MFVGPLEVLFGISIVSLLLSLTGRSFGIREAFANLLLLVFEWASEWQFEEEDEEPSDAAEPPTAVPPEATETVKLAKGKKRIRRPSGDQPLIQRQWSQSMERKLHSDVETDTETESNAGDFLPPPPKNNTVKVIVNDAVEFVMSGIEAIIEDEVTCRFKTAQLASWNLLSRNRTYAHINWRLSVLWIFGLVFRYTILLPVRFFVFTVALIQLFMCSLIIGLIPNEEWRAKCNRISMLTFMRTMARAFGAIIKYHNVENRATSGCVVANHTSPVDCLVLSCETCHAMIGQRHGGILGAVQRALERCSHHIWFERSEARDRDFVRRTLMAHVNDPSKLPVLIFPEGTCINNTSVMMFKKGSFEVSDVVHPIALKYDNRLGDAFWNSSEQGYFGYAMSQLTSWALRADVYYLPPVHRQEGEDAASFARRVKRLIAQAGGLIDLEFDGNLKRSMVPDKLKHAQKELFFQYLTRTTTICDYTPDELETIRKLSITAMEDLPEVFDDDEPVSPETAERLIDGLQRRRRSRDGTLTPLSS